MPTIAYPPEDLRSFFAGDRAYQPGFVTGGPDELDCVGRLTLPDGSAVVATAMVRPLDADREARAEQRLTRLITTEAFRYHMYATFPHVDQQHLETVGGVVMARVLKRIAGHEKALVECWRRTLPAETRRVGWDLGEDTMDLPLPADLVREAESGTASHLDVGLHLRSRCVQKCLFCWRSRGALPFEPRFFEADLAKVRETLERVVRPAQRRGAHVDVHLNADDLLGHPKLEEILALIHSETPGPQSLVVPPNRLADAALAERITRLPGVDGLSITVFGARPESNDLVAGRPGAFREAVLAARNVVGGGRKRLTLHFVLTVHGLSDVVAVAALARHFHARYSVLYPFADYPEAHQVIQSLVPRADQVRAAIEPLVEDLGRGMGRLSDFPVCAIPPAARPYLVSDNGPRLIAYPKLDYCAPCVHRAACVGVPWAYFNVFGVEGLARE